MTEAPPAPPQSEGLLRRMAIAGVGAGLAGAFAVAAAAVGILGQGAQSGCQAAVTLLTDDQLNAGLTLQAKAAILERAMSKVQECMQ